jgi:hypothetical protein
MQYNINNFHIQELMYDSDVDSMQTGREEAYSRSHQLAKEYDLMTYGHKVKCWERQAG